MDALCDALGGGVGQLLERETVREGELRSIAVHEIGHAYVAYMLGREIAEVTPGRTMLYFREGTLVHPSGCDSAVLLKQTCNGELLMDLGKRPRIVRHATRFG